MYRYKNTAAHWQQHSSHKWEQIHKWGGKVNGIWTVYITPITKERKTRIQKIVGTLPYYARWVDLTIMVALGSIYFKQANRNETTSQSINQFLNYNVSHPDSTISYKESDMVLYVHCDGSYLSKSQNCIRDMEGFFLGSQYFDQIDNNGAIITISKIIKNIMASASETEYVAVFINYR